MKYFETNGRIKIPQIGLGTYDLKRDAILQGIEAGYRLLDTAWQYGNEQEVGAAIKSSCVNRDEIFVTTKLWTEHVRKGETEFALKDSLSNLGLDYVDLYLIHWPAVGYEKAWEEMILLKEKGLVKNLAVSNFTVDQLDNISKTGVLPVLNQIESHPYFRNDDIIEYCKKNSILCQAYCPIGGSQSNLKNDALFIELSEKYGKSPVQIILRWHIQRDMLIIPRTKNISRLRENADIYDFELTAEDMKKINSRDTGHRMCADPDNFDF